MFSRICSKRRGELIGLFSEFIIHLKKQYKGRRKRASAADVLESVYHICEKKEERKQKKLIFSVLNKNSGHKMANKTILLI